jgi:hydrogenase nickel incorporation protein HypA/HybF
VHEIGIAENVLGIVERAAGENGFAAVREVVLEVGRLSGVDAEALRFAFEVIAEGTVLQGATITLETPGVLLACRACGREYETDLVDTACPRCGASDFSVARGRDLLVRSVAGEAAPERTSPGTG